MSARLWLWGITWWPRYLLRAFVQLLPDTGMVDTADPFLRPPEGPRISAADIRAVRIAADAIRAGPCPHSHAVGVRTFGAAVALRYCGECQTMLPLTSETGA